MSFNKKIKFIHVGKSGGTSVADQLPHNIKCIHMKKVNFKVDCSYILWVRNPFKRFVSAFYHSKNLIDFEIPSNLSFDDILHNPETPYYKLRNKLKSKLKFGNPFMCEPMPMRNHADGIRYCHLINFFENPNNLAESLTDSNCKIKNDALELMNFGCDHIHKGFGWYLDNGDFVEKHHKNILLVGRVENMRQDLDKLSTLLNKKIEVVKKREGFYEERYLSQLAMKNLSQFYKDTDLRVMNKLHKYGLLDKKTLNEYKSYN